MMLRGHGQLPITLDRTGRRGKEKMNEQNTVSGTGKTEDNSSGSSLDLLLEVQLEATICFGGRQLLLRDILSAAPGSLFELDHDLQEPADLLVAGRLIARGEVVVVDGRFGLRVTELVGP